MENGETNDMRKKYLSLKEKYNELMNLRIDSMRDNIEDLQKKIERHRKIHEIAVGELKRQNEELARVQADIRVAQADVDELERANKRVVEHLIEKDRALEVLLEYPEFEVQCKGVGVFEISCRGFAFTLRRRSETEYKYQPISVPKEIDTPDSFVSKSIAFSSDDLRNFYFQIHTFCKKLCGD